MRSHHLLRCDDNKSAANCQQACCMLIIENFDPCAVSTTYSKSANIKQGQIKSVNWGGCIFIYSGSTRLILLKSTLFQKN